MPPIGHDSQTHALHVLNAVNAAKTLVAELSLAGGVVQVDALPVSDQIKEALRTLFTEVSKLAVFELRGSVRGTLGKLDDETLAEAVREVRAARVLTGDELGALNATEAEVADAFSVDDDAPDSGVDEKGNAAPDAPSAGSDAFDI